MVVKMSQAWFPKNEKALATTFSLCMLLLGCFIAFAVEFE
jgi:hypothetical protein